MRYPPLIATYLWSRDGRRASVLLATALGSVTLIALTASFRLWWLPAATAAVFWGVRADPQALQALATPHVFAGMASVGWVAAVPVLLVAAFVQTPWVPQEQITTTHGTLTGYVLSVNSGFLNVLTDEHQFVILNSSDAVSRK